MTDRVFLRVLLPATQTSFDFRVPLDVTAKEAASLISQLLAVEEPIFWQAQEDTKIMLVQGVGAGALLPHGATIRDLVECGALVDGMSVALV